MKKRIIGLSGVAASGKDLFCEMLMGIDPSIKKFSLAEQLKLDLRDELLEEYDIDILDCTREEKDKIRHRLVEYGGKKRKETTGRYWVEKLTNKINSYEGSVCITDIRYDEYEMDEVFWIKQELGGTLVHISKFLKTHKNLKLFTEAANDEERRNDPRVKAKADYLVEWPVYQGSFDEVKTKVRSHAAIFLNWLEEYEKAKGQPVDMETQEEQL